MQMSPNVIEASLRQHQGNLQSCSEALLASQGDDRPDMTSGVSMPCLLASTAIGGSCRPLLYSAPSCLQEAGLASPADQCWQDEELAMAMQVMLPHPNGYGSTAQSARLCRRMSNKHLTCTNRGQSPTALVKHAGIPRCRSRKSSRAIVAGDTSG